MMILRKLLALIAIFGATQVFAQDENQKGYYIDNLDNRVEVFFKYIDVKNDGFIQVKKQETDEYSKMPVTNVKEYGVGSEFKFVKSTVKLDATAGRTSLYKEPKLESATVFLNTILEGKASLYSFNDGSTTRYFFITDKIPLTQLIYKNYQITLTDPVLENAFFRKQIFDYLVCSTVDVTSVSKLKYNRADLIDVFSNYNECSNAPNIIFENKTARKSKFNIVAFVGAFNSIASFDYYDERSETTNNITPAVGVEFLTRLPSKKLEFFARFEYEMLKTSALLKTFPTIFTAYNRLNYDSAILNFSVGPRYNFLFRDQSNFFVDFSANLGIPLDNFQYVFEVPDAPEERFMPRVVDSKTVISLTFGLGYNFNDKMGIDLRFHPVSNYVRQSDIIIEGRNSRIGCTFRYSIF